MSRCFPFPPPGYEKKDADLLNKEKQKEKKPKKEKKDKEKREDKGKKEKDRSDGKHRDKRDRKEKDKDKDKKKEKEKEKKRNKDKDKKIPSEDKSVVQSDCNKKDKLNEKHSDRDKDKDKYRNSISDEKKRVLQFYGQNGDTPIHDSLFPEGTREFKFVQELCRRIRDEEEGTGSELVDRFPVTERENVVQDRVVLKDARNLAGWKERNNDKGVDSEKISGVDAKFNGSAVVQNIVGLVQNRVEVLPRPLEKQFEQRVEEKEKLKEKEGGDKGVEKRKDKDKEKKSHGKDKERDKEKKKAEKVKEKSESKTKDGSKLQDSKKNDQIGTLNVVNTHGAKDGDRNSATEGILKKRKDLEVNGFLHATEGMPHKMPRPSPNLSTDNGRKLEPCHTAIPFTSAGTEVRPIKLPRPSPCPSVENGRKLEPCQNPILLTSDRQGVSLSNLKLNNKEIKVNGLIESQPLPVSSKRSPSPSTKAEKNVEASTKPPHPDSKYLSQVLSVPKMEDWSDFDDQEWLFSSKDCLAEKIFSSKDCLAEKKPKVESAESPRVWAEALQIESADICALPYVIPY